jgi:3-dehydroquinate synthase
MHDNKNTLDIPFSVPYVHRVRFTRDALGEDVDVLARLFETAEGVRARVQFWVDDNVAAANPDLESRLIDFVESRPRLRLAGPIERLPAGEASKNDAGLLEHMLGRINACDLDRRSYIVAIGGGAVLDAVGFAAAISHRGIRLIRLPTTTLSQADSGVGVKNSINFFRKKNWVGTFAVPWAVVNDARLLSSLPDRDYRCGFAEAVKVTALKDRDAFAAIEALAPRIHERDEDAAFTVIEHSARLHLDHITRGGDPFEELEARPLDYGHWSAHKLEVMSDFELRHGEAVALGVAIDSMYSALKYGLPRQDARRIIGCLTALGLKLDHPCLNRTDELFGGLEEFRQHLGGRLTVTMLTGLGARIDVHEIDRAAMLDAIYSVTAIGADSAPLAASGY